MMRKVSLIVLFGLFSAFGCERLNPPDERRSHATKPEPVVQPPIETAAANRPSGAANGASTALNAALSESSFVAAVVAHGRRLENALNDGPLRADTLLHTEHDAEIEMPRYFHPTSRRRFDTAVEREGGRSHTLSAEKLGDWVAGFEHRVLGFGDVEPASTTCDANCCEITRLPEETSPYYVVREICVERGERGYRLTRAEVTHIHPIVTPGQADSIRNLVVSPKGQEVLIVGDYGTLHSVAPVTYIENGDIWLYQAKSGSLDRLTEDRLSMNPVWAPDGNRFAYSKYADGAIFDIEKRSSRVVLRGEIEDEPENEYDFFAYEPSAWSPDGRLVAFTGSNSGWAAGVMIDAKTDCIVDWSDAEWLPELSLEYEVVVSGERTDEFEHVPLDQPECR